jgi:hypothetical protein
LIYEEIFRALNAKKVKYVVVGGVGLVLHGVVRLTADLDLIVRLETKKSYEVHFCYKRTRL